MIVLKKYKVFSFKDLIDNLENINLVRKFCVNDNKKLCCIADSDDFLGNEINLSNIKYSSLPVDISDVFIVIDDYGNSKVLKNRGI